MVKKEYSAGGVVYSLDENGNPSFLLLKNTLKKTYWEFPKGKIEKKESLEKTVKREVEEETGLKKFEIIPGFSHTLKWYFRFKGQTIKKQAVYMLIKVPKEEKSNVKINHEHQEFRWMSFKEAKKEINIKDIKKMLKKAYGFIKKYGKQKKMFDFKK